MTDAKERIPVFAPIIGAEEKQYINDCLPTHWIAQGPYVREFEDSFSAYCGAKYAVAACNCTAALHMAGLALGIGDGDEVLVSSSTNMASAFSMYYCGAKPVPVDIERDTWQIDPADIERAHTRLIWLVVDTMSPASISRRQCWPKRKKLSGAKTAGNVASLKVILGPVGQMATAMPL